MRNFKHNSYQPCKVCGQPFYKTVTTGRQCSTCRRRGRRKFVEARNYADREHLVKELASPELVLNFIEKIERRAGFVYSLSDINELYEMWLVLGKKLYLYDALPVGEQLYHMWNDLKEWKKSVSKKEYIDA